MRGGCGVKIDKAKAAEWYEKSAQHGFASAQNALGNCYYYGRGKPENKATAVKWYQKAAEQNDANAQYNLGFCYEKGLGGLSRSKKEALKMYQKAAEQGNHAAERAIRRLNGGAVSTLADLVNGVGVLWEILNE